MQTPNVFDENLKTEIRNVLLTELNHLSNLSPEVRSAAVVFDVFKVVLNKICKLVPNDLELGELVRHHLNDILLPFDE